MNSLLISLIIFLLIILYLHRNYKVDMTQVNHKEAYNTLLQIKTNYDKILEIEPKPEFKKYINTIKKKINTIELKENNNKNDGTSYNINKGEEIYICLRDNENNIHDMNKIMYVAIHELAHVGCPEKDHTPLFVNINKELLRMAILAGVYRYQNYNGEQYCGISLTSNILNS